MSFNECLIEGRIRKVPVNTIRAKSLIKSSKQAIETAGNIKLSEIALKSILRELYEGLREYCEAAGYAKGYKFLDHESITHFLAESLNENKISKIFDRYRKLRNGVNYYGNDVDIETIKEALVEIPKVINELKRLGVV